MKVKMEVLGIASVKKYLNITDRFDKHSAFRRSAVTVMINAKYRAPYDTGHLSRNISYEATDHDATIGVSLKVVPYAWYQEAGTSKMPAHPYLRPGLEASIQDISLIFRDEIEKATHAIVTGGKQ